MELSGPKFQETQKLDVQKANFCRHALALTDVSSDISSIEDTFLLFLSPVILNIIVTQTNKKAQTYSDKWNNKLLFIY